MPTAAKLVAAIGFALLAYATCLAIQATMPEDRRVGYMVEVGMACAAIMGWRVSGSAPRTGYAEAAATGLRTATTAVVVTLVVLAVVTMWNTAMRGRYAKPMDAVLDTFDLAAEFGALLLTWPVLATLVLGGALAGLATEWAGRRWR